MTGTFGAIQKARSRIIVVLENLFYRWGRFVARRPFIVIICSLLFTGNLIIRLYRISHYTNFNNENIRSDVFSKYYFICRT